MYYVVTRNTMMIRPLNERGSEIIERDGVRQSSITPEKIIDQSCIIYGASMEGRKQVAKHVLKSSSKLPIPISPKHNFFAFPTASTRNKERNWFILAHIKDYEASEQGTQVNFFNGTTVEIPVSKHSFANQFQRATHLALYHNWKNTFGFGPL